ncbi:MAG TPA: OB-fold domain-containing protein [Acidimicrobiales bacterium]
MAKAKQVPLVDHLVLGERPHLVANRCRQCGARYFGRRSGCASCFGVDFEQVEVPTKGELETFTIVSMAAPGIPVPFAAGVVDCGGTQVRGNVINTEPDPDHVRLGMKLRLATHVVGVDADGTECIGYGFEPLEAS